MNNLKFGVVQPFFLILLIFIFLSPAHGAKKKETKRNPSSKCDIEQIRKNPVATFIHPKNKSVWISLDPQSSELYMALGLEAVAAEAVRSKEVLSFKSCAGPATRHQVFSYSKIPVTLVVQNNCEEVLARKLGFSPSITEDHFGSMEGENQIPWRTFRVCTDGTSLMPCDSPTSEMEKCLKAYL